MIVYVDWANEMLASDFEDFKDKLKDNPDIIELFCEYLNENLSNYDIFCLTKEKKDTLYLDFYNYWVSNYAEKIKIKI